MSYRRIKMNFAEENVSGSDYSEHGEAFQIFNSELLKIKKYFEETQNLGIKKDRELVQTHCELVIIALHIYLEEYLKNVIKYASENDDDLTEKYFQEYKKGDAQTQKEVKIKLLESEVSFSKNAYKLKRIFHHFFGIEFFPNQETEKVILDFNLVRNILIHTNNKPDKNYIDQINCKRIVYNDGKNFRINLINDFMIKVMLKLAKLSVHLQQKISMHYILKKNSPNSEKYRMILENMGNAIIGIFDVVMEDSEEPSIY